MKNSNYIEECCQIFSTAQETETDGLIPCFIRIQQLTEDINKAFGYDGDHGHLSFVESTRIEFLLKNFEQKLYQMKTDFPPEVWDNGKQQLRLM